MHYLDQCGISWIVQFSGISKISSPFRFVRMLVRPLRKSAQLRSQRSRPDRGRIFTSFLAMWSSGAALHSEWIMDSFFCILISFEAKRYQHRYILTETCNNHGGKAMFANRNVIMWLIIDISIILHGNVIPYVLFGYVYWRSVLTCILIILSELRWCSEWAVKLAMQTDLQNACRVLRRR